ncbi:cytochrome b [Aeromonas veronii]|uniref:cytochrome b n=1 Tax=Aeromonas veronii TaxID=654 RepID=UPI0035BA9F60
MTEKYYDRVSRALHWVMAIVIIYATVAGYVMHIVIGSKPDIFYYLSVINMSMATVITPLFLLRWFWRYLRDPMPMVSNTTGQYKLASLMHSLLYLLMFIVLLSGFLMLKSSYSFFGVYQIPNVVNSSEVNDFFFLVHRAGCMVLAALITLHITAALHHHLVVGNRTLYRMLGPITQK